MRHAIFMTGTYLLMNLICSYNVFCICMLKLVNMVACVKFFLDGKYSSQYFVDYFFFPLVCCVGHLFFIQRWVFIMFPVCVKS